LIPNITRQTKGKPIVLPRPTDPSYLYKAEVRDVFYAFNNQGIGSTFLKGRYLNQELIDKGFAKPV
jgi:hypothetical protein